MDATTLRLVDFALEAEFSAIPPAAVDQCKRRLIDGFACAVAAFDAPLSVMARAVGARHPAGPGLPAARIWGTNDRVAPEAAAFANGVMLRLLDLSDMYGAKAAGHPSDVIPGIIAVGEALHADGRSVINAVTLAYDLYCSFCEAIDFSAKGWDQPVFVGMACALAVGRLLGLSRTQMGNALALALAPNMALYQTRRGEVSGWKGCAAANASRNAVFAAYLARDGFTGPTAVFEGESGLWDIVGRFDWQVSRGWITRTHMKCFPLCYHGQSAVWAAFDVRQRLRVEDIRDIQVETYPAAIRLMANDPTRWAPRTHETADHSLPYVVAVALLDGEITSRSFSSARLSDPAVATLMRMVKVDASPEISAQYPEAAPCRLRITTRAGDVVVAECRYPKGHARNPMSDAQLEAKFVDLFGSFGNRTQCRTALEMLRHLDQVTDIGEATGVFLKNWQEEPAAPLGHSSAAAA